jgi:hypothetical protein
MEFYLRALNASPAACLNFALIPAQYPGQPAAASCGQALVKTKALSSAEKKQFIIGASGVIKTHAKAPYRRSTTPTMEGSRNDTL